MKIINKLLSLLLLIILSFNCVVFAEDFNSKEPQKVAPWRLHQLVKVKGKLEHKESEQKLHTILDFLWGDEEGKILLKAAIKYGIPICLTKKIKTSQLTNIIYKQKTSIVGYHNPKTFTPYNLNIADKIYIKEKHIADFQNPNSKTQKNGIAIMVVAHELCHFIKAINFPTSKNSQEEELIAYLIGYNIASRIIENEPLSKEKVKKTSEHIYNSHMLHKGSYYHDLQEYDDFAQKMESLGFKLPHHEVYKILEDLKK